MGKAFSCIVRSLLLWRIWELGIAKLIVGQCKQFLEKGRPIVQMTDSFSEPFIAIVGVNQDLVIHPLLFIIVREVSFREFSTGCLWDLLYVDNVILSYSCEVLTPRLHSLEDCWIIISILKMRVFFSNPVIVKLVASKIKYLMLYITGVFWWLCLSSVLNASTKSIENKKGAQNNSHTKCFGSGTSQPACSIYELCLGDDGGIVSSFSYLRKKKWITGCYLIEIVSRS